MRHSSSNCVEDIDPCISTLCPLEPNDDDSPVAVTQSRHYHLARSGEILRPVLMERPPAKPRPRQVLIRVGAVSLNYRDLLVLKDPGSNPEGLIPLSDCAGTIVTVGEKVTRWKSGDRVSPNFFPNWHSGPFSQTYLGKALGGGATDGVLADFIVADEGSRQSRH